MVATTAASAAGRVRAGVDCAAVARRSQAIISLCVGAAAGALDVLPKVFQGASARSCFSAFFIFLFSAVIVFHADLPYLPWWADGMGTTLMLSIPVFFTLAGKERKTIPVFVFDALLFGLLISLAEHYLS